MGTRRRAEADQGEAAHTALEVRGSEWRTEPGAPDVSAGPLDPREATPESHPRGSVRCPRSARASQGGWIACKGRGTDRPVGTGSRLRRFHLPRPQPLLAPGGERGDDRRSCLGQPRLRAAAAGCVCVETPSDRLTQRRDAEPSREGP